MGRWIDKFYLEISIKNMIFGILVIKNVFFNENVDLDNIVHDTEISYII